MTDLEDQERIKPIFNENGVIHQNFIENIKFKNAQSLQYLRRIVLLRAKSLIYSSPKIRHHGQTRGINSEIFFGKN